jgi:hypothetical protein
MVPLLVACTGLVSLLISLIPDRAFIRFSIKIRLITILAPVLAFASATKALPITSGMAACMSSAQTLTIDLATDAVSAPGIAVAFYLETGSQLNADIATFNVRGIANVAENMIEQSGSGAYAIFWQTFSDAEATVDACY